MAPLYNVHCTSMNLLTIFLRFKMISQIQQNKWQGCQISGDYKGEDFTANITLGRLAILVLVEPRDVVSVCSVSSYVITDIGW